MKHKPCGATSWKSRLSLRFGPAAALSTSSAAFFWRHRSEVNTLRTDVPEQQALREITGAGAVGGFWQTLQLFGPTCPVLVHIGVQRIPIFLFPSWRYNKDPGLTKHSCKQHKTTLTKIRNEIPPMTPVLPRDAPVCFGASHSPEAANTLAAITCLQLLLPTKPTGHLPKKQRAIPSPACTQLGVAVLRGRGEVVPLSSWGFF